MPASTLTISIVTYRPDLALLERTLRRLAASLTAATDEQLLRAVNVALIDNTGERGTADVVVRLGQTIFEGTGFEMSYLHGHANIGYGAAHNLVMHGGNTHYHLVLNPDVEMEVDALPVALRHFSEHSGVGVIAPAVSGADGTREYLCKRYPAVLDLLLRGLAPDWMRHLFRARMERYEMRDLIDPKSVVKGVAATAAAERVVSPVPIISGAFMLVRRRAIEATGGFDPAFFLYFEDFDWSVRLNRVTETVYLPTVRIVHHGGRAARKGIRHVGYFARSAIRFFNKNGWRWW